MLSACESEGALRKDGSISPCGGYHTDKQACGNAIFNAKALPAVHTGQSMDEVRSIMKHEAERRNAEGLTESWGVISDCDAEQMTWITFTDGKVTKISQGPWK
jgi:hypothetical protein